MLSHIFAMTIGFIIGYIPTKIIIYYIVKNRRANRYVSTMRRLKKSIKEVTDSRDYVVSLNCKFIEEINRTKMENNNNKCAADRYFKMYQDVGECCAEGQAKLRKKIIELTEENASLVQSLLKCRKNNVIG